MAFEPDKVKQSLRNTAEPVVAPQETETHSAEKIDLSYLNIPKKQRKMSHSFTIKEENYAKLATLAKQHGTSASSLLDSILDQIQ